MPNAPVRVSPTVRLDVWYERSFCTWYARYLDNDDDQIGNAWCAQTRDLALIFRPPTPDPG